MSALDLFSIILTVGSAAWAMVAEQEARSAMTYEKFYKSHVELQRVCDDLFGKI